MDPTCPASRPRETRCVADQQPLVRSRQPLARSGQNGAGGLQPRSPGRCLGALGGRPQRHRAWSKDRPARRPCRRWGCACLAAAIRPRLRAALRLRPALPGAPYGSAEILAASVSSGAPAQRRRSLRAGAPERGPWPAAAPVDGDRRRHPRRLRDRLPASASAWNRHPSARCGRLDSRARASPPLRPAA